jgi:hypothetical protein
VAEFFTPARNLVFGKIRPQFSNITDFNKKPKLHALERFFLKVRQPLNCLMHSPGFCGKDLTVPEGLHLFYLLKQAARTVGPLKQSK